MAPYSEKERRRNEEKRKKEQAIQNALVAVGKKITSRYSKIMVTSPGIGLTIDVPYNDCLIVYRTLHSTSCKISEVIAEISYTDDDSIECHIPIQPGRFDISNIVIESLASKARALGVKEITITR